MLRKIAYSLSRPAQHPGESRWCGCAGCGLKPIETPGVQTRPFLAGRSRSDRAEASSFEPPCRDPLSSYRGLLRARIRPSDRCRRLVDESSPSWLNPGLAECGVDVDHTRLQCKDVLRKRLGPVETKTGKTNRPAREPSRLPL